MVACSLPGAGVSAAVPGDECTVTAYPSQSAGLHGAGTEQPGWPCPCCPDAAHLCGIHPTWHWWVPQTKMGGWSSERARFLLSTLISQAPCPQVVCLSALASCLPFCGPAYPLEKGDFLVLELGATGASLRVLWVTLTGMDGHRVEPRSQEFVIPKEVMLGTGQEVSAHCTIPESGAARAQVCSADPHTCPTAL